MSKLLNFLSKKAHFKRKKLHGSFKWTSTGVLSCDEENETIKIDHKKCISCGACEKMCPIGAIRVAHSKEKYKINELTTLLIFKNKNYLGKIEGYYSAEQKEEFIEKINELLEK